jgi:hypothetical protein
MTYIEIAVSDGPGTLVQHFVFDIGHAEFIRVPHFDEFIIQTLTKAEYTDFIAMHGGTVAT